MPCGDNRETHELPMTWARRKILQNGRWQRCLILRNMRSFWTLKGNSSTPQSSKMLGDRFASIRQSWCRGSLWLSNCNKVLFKGTIEQRKDVKKKLEQRRGYRRYHRYHKHYRPARFNNRASSRRSGRLMPSIIQRKQAILRVIDRLRQWIRMDGYWLEDVKIDMRALTDGYKPYHWQYQKSTVWTPTSVLRQSSVTTASAWNAARKIPASRYITSLQKRKAGPTRSAI